MHVWGRRGASLMQVHLLACGGRGLVQVGPAGVLAGQEVHVIGSDDC